MAAIIVVTASNYREARSALTPTLEISYKQTPEIRDKRIRESEIDSTGNQR
jgi:hypothetical protein